MTRPHSRHRTPSSSARTPGQWGGSRNNPAEDYGDYRRGSRRFARADLDASERDYPEGGYQEGGYGEEGYGAQSYEEENYGGGDFGAHGYDAGGYPEGDSEDEGYYQDSWDREGRYSEEDFDAEGEDYPEDRYAGEGFPGGTGFADFTDFDAPGEYDDRVNYDAPEGYEDPESYGDDASWGDSDYAEGDRQGYQYGEGHGGGGDARAAGEPAGADKRTNVLLVVLVALALIASVVMLLTNNSIALRIALLAALWAAVIGFFLVARYRRAADFAREELAYTRELREAERERAEARAVSTPVTPAGLNDEDMELLAQIRDQLSDLRERLEDLQGRSLEYEPAALRAQAWRLNELEGKAESTWVAHEKAGDVPGAPSLDAVAGRLGGEDRPRPTASGISPELADLLREGEGDPTGSAAHPADAGHRGAHERPGETRFSRETAEAGDTWEEATRVESTLQEAQGAGRGAEAEPEPRQEVETQGGRRRADSNDGALTVAELLARRNK